MKNPNGFGTVYELKGKRRRPWIARKSIGCDDNGRQKWVTIGYYETYRKGYNALVELNKKDASIGLSLDSSLEDLYTKWSASKYQKIAKKTKQSYETAWNHLDPIKNLKVINIKKSHLQDIIDDLKAKKYSYSSIHKVKVLTKMMFDMALADDLVNKNYAELIELPKKQNKEKEPFTDLEIKAIENLAKKDKWAKAIMIMIYTGLRIGEVLSLTKFNIDLKKNLITGGSKTEAGKNRIVPISNKILDYIKYWYNTEGSLLINLNGKRIRVDYFREEIYYPTIKKAGTRKLTPHSTRHTFATLLSNSGADTKAIQKIIGHASYSTTADIYTHKNVDELIKAINLL
jgi:integrase